MDYSEFVEWMAYCRIDPFGNERADLHAAMITSMLYNAHRGKGESKSPSDFMPDFGPPKPAGEQIMSALNAIKSQQGTD